MKRVERYRFLILGLLMLLTASFKVADDFIIDIKMSAVAGFNECSFFTIKGNGSKVSIHYLRIDNVYYTKMYKDAAYIENLKSYKEAKNDSLIKIFSKHFEKTVQLKQANQSLFFRQIDSMLHTPDNVLLYESPKRKVYMDGTVYDIDVKAGAINRKLRVINPDGDFAAPIYRFLCSTFRFSGALSN